MYKRGCVHVSKGYVRVSVPFNKPFDYKAADTCAPPPRLGMHRLFRRLKLPTFKSRESPSVPPTFVCDCLWDWVDSAQYAPFNVDWSLPTCIASP